LALSQLSASASGRQVSDVATHLRRLPVPRPGQVLGLVGTNGIGKSTALKILAGKLKPNLGRLDVSDAPAALNPKGCSIVLAVCLCWLLHACHEAALKAAPGLQ
jgi:ABC-type hemin transport system ATPase subunit